MHDLLWASAVAQAAAIRRGDCTSEALVAACFDRIAAVNPAINAVVQSDAAAAMEAARTADRRLAAGQPCGPLHGVPFTVKDWIETNDLPCAAGFEARKEYVPHADATVVARLRAAGAILLGKTNVLEHNPVYGATLNPYDVTRSAGASTSGEAAVIAAGGSPLGLGSDSGGSLRVPAHFCGIATLKPSAGRVPNTGHFPRISAMTDPRTQIGPMSRHVEDLWTALRVIAGPDWRDAGVVPVPLADPEMVQMRGRRVAYLHAFQGVSPSAETVAAVDAAVAALRDAGATTVEACPPEIGDSYRISVDYWSRVESVSWTRWSPPPNATTALDGDGVQRHLFEWDRFRRAMLAFIEQFDLLLCPVAERPAVPHGTMELRDYVYTLPFSLTGWPVAVVRAGTGDAGMPIGVQLAAQPWRDDVAVAAAARVEAALGGWQPPSL